MKQFVFDNHNYFQAMGVNLISLSIGFTEIDNVIKTSALLVGLCYTCWKWFREWEKTRK